MLLALNFFPQTNAASCSLAAASTTPTTTTQCFFFSYLIFLMAIVCHGQSDHDAQEDLARFGLQDKFVSNFAKIYFFGYIGYLLEMSIEI